MTDPIKDEFEKLLELNNKKKSTRTTRAAPVVPATKDRLAAYNRAVAKKNKRKAFHDLLIDTVIIVSFIVVIYIALRG